MEYASSGESFKVMRVNEVTKEVSINIKEDQVPGQISIKSSGGRGRILKRG